MNEMNIFISALDASAEASLSDLKSLPEQDHVFSKRFESKMSRILRAAPGRAGLFAAKYRREIIEIAAGAAACLAIIFVWGGPDNKSEEIEPSDWNGIGGVKSDMSDYSEREVGISIPDADVDGDVYTFVQRFQSHLEDPSLFLGGDNEYIYDYSDNYTLAQGIDYLREMIGSDTDYTPALSSDPSQISASIAKEELSGYDEQDHEYSIECYTLYTGLNIEISVFDKKEDLKKILSCHPEFPAKVTAADGLREISYQYSVTINKKTGEKVDVFYYYTAIVEYKDHILMFNYPCEVDNGEADLCEMISALI